MAHEERWNKYFVHYDTNKNGFLDPEDFAIIGKHVDEAFGYSSDAADSVSKMFYDFFLCFIKELDIDKDGKLTREEVLQGARTHFLGKSLEDTPKWWLEQGRKVFAVFDKNKNGELSLDEVKAYVKKINPKETDANIEHAFEWIKKSSSSGKFDSQAFLYLLNTFAGSPDPTPEAEVLLPFMRDC